VWDPGRAEERSAAVIRVIGVHPRLRLFLRNAVCHSRLTLFENVRARLTHAHDCDITVLLYRARAAQKRDRSHMCAQHAQ
jgi:hypothetical protein